MEADMLSARVSFCASVLATLMVVACGNGVGAACAVTAEQYPCNSGVITDENAFGDVVSCAFTPFEDGSICRTGVGVCESGVCVNAPGAVGACVDPNPGALPSPAAIDGCGTDADCATDNPCVIGTCPNNGDNGCFFRAAPERLPCGDGLFCQSGVCC